MIRSIAAGITTVALVALSTPVVAQHHEADSEEATEMTFEGTEVTGEPVGPNGTGIDVTEHGELESLVDIRQNFLHTLVRTPNQLE